MSDMYESARAGDAARVRALLVTHRMNTELTNNDGRTPVMGAAMSTNSLEPLHVLLEVGANVNKRDKRGWNALHYACAYGNCRAVEMILNAGADINQRDNEGFEAIHIAAQFNHSSVLQLMIDSGSNIEATAKSRETPLIVASGKKPTNMTVLLTNGASINSQTTWCSNALHWACKLGCSESVSILLDHEAQVNVRNKKGDTALHLACQNTSASVIIKLLKCGAEVNATNSQSRNPLFVASESNNIDGVRVLLDHGGDPDAQDTKGNTPLHIAASKMHTSVVDALLLKARVDIVNNIGRTPLMVASAVGSVAVRLLINSGSDCMPDHADYEGNTAIHLACVNGHVEVGQVLTNHRVKLDIVNKAGQIPVVAAAEASHGEMTRMMVHRMALHCPGVIAKLKRCILEDRDMSENEAASLDVSQMIKDWFDDDIVDLILKYKQCL